MKDQKEVFADQLALDYSCTAEQVKSGQHIFTRKEYRQGRRIFRGDDALVRIACVGDTFLVTAEEEMLDWCKEHLAKASPYWFLMYPHMYELDQKLREFGHQIGSAHHFYLPGGVERFDGKCPTEGISLKWYEEKDLEVFRNDNPFPEALSFIRECPDVIAVAAQKGETVLGMAGASRDCGKMWQIGINVTDAGRGMGIGTYLVTHLKREILNRGILPFYGTAESHIKSQKVAVQSGFLPAWAEVYSMKIG
ncbi:MAG: GNAT family N-acetyltransferase [Lachnospiraceae bacterium]|jgi:GNAT superfamily N-acetyltransferase|nr:GNAT family N-acetyltransferase [Lachnospiraceae bacterium]